MVGFLFSVLFCDVFVFLGMPTTNSNLFVLYCCVQNFYLINIFSPFIFLVTQTHTHKVDFYTQRINFIFWKFYQKPKKFSNPTNKIVKEKLLLIIIIIINNIFEANLQNFIVYIVCARLLTRLEVYMEVAWWWWWYGVCLVLLFKWNLIKTVIDWSTGNNSQV